MPPGLAPVIVQSQALLPALVSSVVFGERFGPMRLAGMALVLLGLAVIVLPLDRRARRGAAAALQPR